PAKSIRILLVSPLALQLTGTAPVIVIAEGPVNVKSLPFAAIDEQSIASAKSIVIDVGVQPGCCIVPIGIGVCAASVNGAELPGVTVLPHEPSKVFPSDPLFITTW